MIEYKLEANIQNVENMKKTVNRTNQLVHNTVLYMSYEEEKSYYILSKLQCLLMHNAMFANAQHSKYKSLSCCDS